MIVLRWADGTEPEAPKHPMTAFRAWLAERIERACDNAEHAATRDGERNFDAMLTAYRNVERYIDEVERSDLLQRAADGDGEALAALLPGYSEVPE